MLEFYLGIDVGYAQNRNSTGLCLLTVDQSNFTWHCHNIGNDNHARRKALRALVPCGTKLSGVGIDGPLVRDLEEVNCYRPADALLSGGIFEGLCKPAPANSGDRKLHHHATKLANLVLELPSEVADAHHPEAIHQRIIVEAFPNAFLAFLLSINEIPLRVPRGKKSDRYWEIAVKRRYLHGLIERLAPGRRLHDDLGRISNHDHRAAFVCALTAMCVARNQYVAVGDPQYGDIMLPPKEVWGLDSNNQCSWAEIPLRKRVSSVRKNKWRLNHDIARIICNGRHCMPEL